MLGPLERVRSLDAADAFYEARSIVGGIKKESAARSFPIMSGLLKVRRRGPFLPDRVESDTPVWFYE
jgi:hypothetical protein